MATPLDPIVQLFDVDTGDEYDNDETIIDLGDVKAGEMSDVLTLRVWNNKEGTEVASTMRDVELFVLDSNEGKEEPIVEAGWLHAKCTSGNDESFTRLTDSNALTLTAKDQGEGEILGSINDGLDTDTDNFAEFELYCQIVEDFLTVLSGEKEFSLAIKYYYT